MNKVILMGRLTRDPEVKYSPNSNINMTLFTIAVNKRTGNGEKSADFFNIIAWNKTGEFVSKYFKKGLQVGIIGRLSTRDYEDLSGNKKHVTEVIAEEVYFADKNYNN